jgi:hypothetical protein
MNMANPEAQGSSPEKKGLGKELKKLSPEIKNLSSIEREALEKDLAQRGEKAEKIIEKHKVEKEPVIETQEATQEKSKSAGESTSHATKHRPQPKTDRERNSLYRHELKEMQSKLPAIQRTFSKVIHNTSVDKISDLTQETIFRPSAMIGGAIVGLILGITIYAVASIYRYSISNLEILLLAFLGSLFGVLVESVVRRFGHRK